MCSAMLTASAPVSTRWSNELVRWPMQNGWTIVKTLEWLISRQYADDNRHQFSHRSRPRYRVVKSRDLWLVFMQITCVIFESLTYDNRLLTGTWTPDVPRCISPSMWYMLTNNSAKTDSIAVHWKHMLICTVLTSRLITTNFASTEGDWRSRCRVNRRSRYRLVYSKAYVALSTHCWKIASSAEGVDAPKVPGNEPRDIFELVSRLLSDAVTSANPTSDGTAGACLRDFSQNLVLSAWQQNHDDTNEYGGRN